MPIKLKIMVLIVFCQISIGVGNSCAKADVFSYFQQDTFYSQYIFYAADGMDSFTHRFEEYKDKDQKNDSFKNSIGKLKYFLFCVLAIILGIILVFAGLLIYRLFLNSTHRKLLHK